MIICHNRKFIFIKTQKTGSTSLEIVLSQFCGPGDVVTPISTPDERVRRSLGYSGPRNYVGLTPLFDGSRRSRVDYFLRCLRCGHLPRKFYNHIPASLVKERVRTEVWESYYKFTVCRNPIQRALSLYYWLGLHGMDFSRFLREYSEKIAENWSIVSEDDQFLLDGFVHQEHMEKDWVEVMTRLGINKSGNNLLDNVQAKAGVRPSSGLTKSDLNKDQKQFIAFLCAPELEKFGYSIE